VVTWRRAQIVLLSAQGMPAAKIAQVTFTAPDRVRDVIHSFNVDGFDRLKPRYAGGRPPTFTLPQRRLLVGLDAKMISGGLATSIQKIFDSVIAPSRCFAPTLRRGIW
jgi:transposase